MSEKTTEEMIQDKGLNAPRLNPTLLESLVVSEVYHVFPGTTTTVCHLTIGNGFSVNGESAAVSIENFDVGIGRKVARDNAIDKLWPLAGILLKNQLSETPIVFKGN